MRTVHRLGAQHLDAHGAIVLPAAFAEHAPGALEDGGAHRLGLLRRLCTYDHERGRAAKPVRVREAGLVSRRGRQPARPADLHPVTAQVHKSHRAEITDDIGQDVARRIVHLVGDLLGNRRWAHQAARAGRLAHQETPVGRALDDRVADVIPVSRAGTPVREDAAGGLGAALDDVSGKAAQRQLVKVARLPAEGMDQRRQRHGTVGAAAGHDDVSASGQCLRDRKGPEIGIRADDLGRQRAAALHVRDARSPQRHPPGR